MADVAKAFNGLPIGLLICQPILEVAKGQAALCDVYLDFILKLAFKDGKDSGETRCIEFQLERPVTNGDGSITKTSYSVSAPILSLVPVPAFTMEEASVNFTMEVKEQTADKSSTEASATASASYKSFWGFQASISGSVTTKSENTRSTDSSAKYDIHARAIQQPPAEGMAKLTSIFASVIEPIQS